MNKLLGFLLCVMLAVSGLVHARAQLPDCSDHASSQAQPDARDHHAVATEPAAPEPAKQAASGDDCCLTGVHTSQQSCKSTKHCNLGNLALPLSLQQLHVVHASELAWPAFADWPAGPPASVWRPPILS